MAERQQIIRQWVAKVRKWLHPSASAARSHAPYEVACACGILLRGFREAQHQVARCTNCGREVFVLPLSPLPTVVQESGTEPAQAALPAARSRLRRGPILASAALLVGLLTLASWYVLRYIDTKAGGPNSRETDLGELREHVRSGRRALQDGNFQSAVEELEQAVAIRNRRPGLLALAESRTILQVHTEALLLADLLTESLEEILHRLDGQELREGQAAFIRRYGGKAVIFFSRVRRDAAGRFGMDYRIVNAGQEARLELEAVKILQHLPLQAPQQMLFGIRLAGVRREPAGNWVILLQPDSGVLFTDLGAAQTCCFPPLEPMQLEGILQRQAAWLAELP